MRLSRRLFLANLIFFIGSTLTFAATPVQLQHQSAATLKTLAGADSTLKEISRHVDFHHTQHIRLRQLYRGYPVWGADVVEHIKNGNTHLLAASSVNGKLYQNLAADLKAPTRLLTRAPTAEKILQQAIESYQTKNGTQATISQPKTEMLVYVDEKNIAHWAYRVSFFVTRHQQTPTAPTYIIDADKFKIYKEWDNLQTWDTVQGGGFGGNPKIGKFSYDGLLNDLPALSFERDSSNNLCYIENADVVIKDVRKDDAVMQFQCSVLDNEHNNEYWNADQDATNGSYSPANDAMFASQRVKEMYQAWYNLPVLVADGQPMQLNLYVHKNMTNAYWQEDGTATFGDGDEDYYPFVSLGIVAHELSHGFTYQHSNLVYMEQSGGLNEAFSDMAAQAAEFYVFGHNNWQIGGEITKAKDKIIRYMDQPAKSCAEDQMPGEECPIEDVTQFYSKMNVHLSSGVFNRAFYLLATTKNWDTKKAFDVMVKANMDYWTPLTDFAQAACGVIQAAKDYQYDVTAVKNAMTAVKISLANCTE